MKFKLPEKLVQVTQNLFTRSFEWNILLDAVKTPTPTRLGSEDSKFCRFRVKQRFKFVVLAKNKISRASRMLNAYLLLKVVPEKRYKCGLPTRANFL